MGRSEFTEGSATNEVGMVVTLALFLHKAPEAAGYGTFILHNQLPILKRIAYISVSTNFQLKLIASCLIHIRFKNSNQTINFIQTYALCSPITAFLSYLAFAKSAEAANDEESIQNLNYWTGFILLMAAGTLLYTTMLHILPEVYIDNGATGHSHCHGELEMENKTSVSLSLQTTVFLT